MTPIKRIQTNLQILLETAKRRRDDSCSETDIKEKMFWSGEVSALFKSLEIIDKVS